MHFLSHSKALMLSVLLSIISFSSVVSMELIAARSVSSPESVQLYSNHRDLFVQDENAAYRVEKHNMNPLLKEVMQRQAMGKFTEDGQGYLRVKQLSDGKYLLSAYVRGKGGFLLTGVVVYHTCRVVGYSALVLGSIGTVAAATAGGGPVAGYIAAGQVIQASAPAAAAIESGSLAIGTAASWIPGLP